MQKTQKKEMLQRILQALKEKPIHYLENLYKKISFEQETENFDWEGLNDEIYQRRKENNKNMHNNINNIIF